MTTERNYEEEAKDQGWVPKEEWKGDPEKHVEAEEFVKRADTFVPFLKKKVESLESSIDTLIKQNEQDRKAADRQGFERAEAQYKKQIEDLTAKQRQAVDEGDTEKFDRIERQKQELKKPEAKAEANEPEGSAEWNQWLAENEWFETDEELAFYADGYANRLQSQHIQAGGELTAAKLAEIRRKVTKKVKAQYPHKFGNPNRDLPNTVESGRDAPTNGNGKLRKISDIKDAKERALAKDALKNLQKHYKLQGRDYTEKEYIEAYN